MRLLLPFLWHLGYFQCCHSSLRVLFALGRASSTRRLPFLRLSSILRGTREDPFLPCVRQSLLWGLALFGYIAPFSERLPVKVLHCAGLPVWMPGPALRGALCGPVVPNLLGGLRISSCALLAIWFSELWAFLVARFRGVATGMLQSSPVVTVCSWSLGSGALPCVTAHLGLFTGGWAACPTHLRSRPWRRLELKGYPYNILTFLLEDLATVSRSCCEGIEAKSRPASEKKVEAASESS